MWRIENRRQILVWPTYIKTRPWMIGFDPSLTQPKFSKNAISQLFSSFPSFLKPNFNSFNSHSFPLSLNLSLFLSLFVLRSFLRLFVCLFVFGSFFSSGVLLLTHLAAGGERNLCFSLFCWISLWPFFFFIFRVRPFLKNLCFVRDLFVQGVVWCFISDLEFQSFCSVWEDFAISIIDMNMMRRLKSIASGRTSISSDPVSIAFILILILGNWSWDWGIFGHLNSSIAIANWEVAWFIRNVRFPFPFPFLRILN